MFFVKLLSERGLVRELNLCHLLEIEPAGNGKSKLYFNCPTTLNGATFLTTRDEIAALAENYDGKWGSGITEAVTQHYADTK